MKTLKFWAQVMMAVVTALLTAFFLHHLSELRQAHELVHYLPTKDPRAYPLQIYAPSVATQKHTVQATPVKKDIPAGPASFGFASKEVTVPSSTTNHLSKRSVPWLTFLNNDYVEKLAASNVSLSSLRTYPSKLIICPDTISQKLQVPALGKDDMDWCSWATKKDGGGVEVGKSWGKLSTTADRKRFDSVNCNAVNAGKNPSCDDAWGDSHIRNWKQNKDNKVQCQAGRKSKIDCYLNENKDRFCVLEKVMIDFSKARKIDKGTTVVASKKFQQDYMTMDCHDGDKEPGFTFPHLLSPKTTANTKAVCDYVIEDTVLLFSHDNIRNMAHTLNDILNVWVMLWLDGKAGATKDIPFLTIDAMKQYNNFDDAINQYFTVYEKNFQSILRGAKFGPDSTLCLNRVLVQPLPARGFVWDNWHNDLPCSFVGPSSLYQRWNLQVRRSFGLLDAPARPKSQPIKVVLIVRMETANDWGSYRTSRLFLNLPEIEAGIRKLQGQSRHKFELVVQNLAELPFDAQVALMSETSILVGMHGAGIAQSQYLPVGTERCCGVLEIFPKGEFTPVRGFANMIRKMGLSYQRIDVAAQQSLGMGAQVPVAELVAKLSALLDAVHTQPACVLPQVVENPYLQL